MPRLRIEYGGCSVRNRSSPRRSATHCASTRFEAGIDDVLDRIDEIVPPGTDAGTLDQAYVPPAIQQAELRRRPLSERSAA